MYTLFLSIITLVMADLFEVKQASPLSATNDTITITAAKAAGQNKPQMLATGYLCVYANGTLTISSVDTLTSITFGSCDVSQLAKLTPSTGAMTQEIETDPIWNGKAQSVTFTVSAKAEYAKSKNQKKAGQLKFMTLSLNGQGGGGEVDTVLVKGVDLYYGHYSGETKSYTNYNHQLWLMSEGLIFDGEGIEGTDGRVMRLDLFSASATDLSGTYTITDPKDADNPGCINKKYSYYTYMEGGSFVEQKLILGTCTIQCVIRDTYDITYDVQEITTYTRHKATLYNIPISAVQYDGSSYALQPTCTQSAGFEQVKNLPSPCRKVMVDGQLLLLFNGVYYSPTGQQVY